MIFENILIEVAFVTFLLGIVAKIADLFNDNGLVEYFPHCSKLSGLAWGLLGMWQIFISPFAGITYVAHIIYWFLRVKLDDFNHSVAGVIMILSAFYFQGEFFNQHSTELIAVFLGYAITGYIHSYFKNNFKSSRLFLRLRLRIYLVPLFYSFYTGNFEPIAATVGGMIGCEWITYIYRNYKDKDESVLQFS